MSFGDHPIAGRPHEKFLLAVVGPALLTAVGTIVLTGFESGQSEDIASLFLMTFALAAAVIAIASIVIGLPLTWLLEQRGLERPWSYPLAGFIAGGAIIVLVPALLNEDRGGPFEFLPFAWVGALPGCFCGAIWWWTYRRHVQAAEDRAR